MDKETASKPYLITKSYFSRVNQERSTRSTLLRTTFHGVFLAGCVGAVYYIFSEVGTFFLRNRIDFSKEIDHNYTIASASGWKAKLATSQEVEILPMLPVIKEHSVGTGEDLFSAGTLGQSARISLEVKNHYLGIAIRDSLGIIGYRKLVKSFEDPNTFIPINLFKNSQDIRFAQIQSLVRNNFNVTLKTLVAGGNDIPVQPANKIPVETIIK